MKKGKHEKEKHVAEKTCWQNDELCIFMSQINGYIT